MVYPYGVPVDYHFLKDITKNISITYSNNKAILSWNWSFPFPENKIEEDMTIGEQILIKNKIKKEILEYVINLERTKSQEPFLFLDIFDKKAKILTLFKYLKPNINKYATILIPAQYRPIIFKMWDTLTDLKDNSLVFMPGIEYLYILNHFTLGIKYNNDQLIQCNRKIAFRHLKLMNLNCSNIIKCQLDLTAEEKSDLNRISDKLKRVKNDSCGEKILNHFSVKRKNSQDQILL